MLYFTNPLLATNVRLLVSISVSSAVVAVVSLGFTCSYVCTEEAAMPALALQMLLHIVHV